jgi:hypothetical protein
MQASSNLKNESVSTRFINLFIMLRVHPPRIDHSCYISKIIIH